MAALVEQAVGGDLAAVGRAGHAAEAVGAQQRLRGGLDRGAGAVGLGLECPDRVVRRVGVGELLLGARLAGDPRERLVELACRPGRRPSAPRPRCRRRCGAAANSSGASRCSAATAQKSPPSVERRSSSPAAASRHATSSAPSQVPAPATGDQVCDRGAGERERVEHVHRARAARRRRTRRAEQVGLDRRGDRPGRPTRAAPGSPGRPTCPTAAARTRRAAWRASAQQQPSAVAAEHEPPAGPPSPGGSAKRGSAARRTAAQRAPGSRPASAASMPRRAERQPRAPAAPGASSASAP